MSKPRALSSRPCATAAPFRRLSRCLTGAIRIGLTDDDLEHLATSRAVIKLSRRDLPVALATRADGATTVAATMICASLADISVFATGGIGGVHRGAEKTLDISADLDELALTNVAVVCAGAKAILDLAKTAEYLENSRRAGAGLRHRRVAGLLYAEQRHQAGVALRRSRDGGARICAPRGSLGLRAAR